MKPMILTVLVAVTHKRGRRYDASDTISVCVLVQIISVFLKEYLEALGRRRCSYTALFYKKVTFMALL